MVLTHEKPFSHFLLMDWIRLDITNYTTNRLEWMTFLKPTFDWIGCYMTEIGRISYDEHPY